ncbi:DUF4350 domain-containing protein [Effusibacillus dendaii]|uniref:Uncharacterized protein n=1 Tax=Effusibacillus dendaii TaxID=2743772 RepID=A0A7I8DA59_9BACL|nr:DUF4350 domain-containing protein [Effusibacillus dendaii]BCJ85849.1 hypothetical protein skT53_08340 [Effusibacillus dendaii]
MKMIYMIVRLSLLLLVVGLWPTQSWAANNEDSLILSVETGINGLYKGESLIPVKVTLTSRYDNFSGTVQVSHRYVDAANYEKPITVAAGKSANVTFQLSAAILNQDGRVIVKSNGTPVTEQPFKSNPFNGVLVGTVGEKGLFSFLDRQDAANQIGIAVTSLQAEDVASPDSLRNLDLLVLNDPNFTLSEEQAKAVSNWVELGGTLIVGSVSNSLKDLPSFVRLLPMQMDGQITANLQSLSRYTDGSPIDGSVTVGKAVTVNGNKLIEDNGIPIIADKKVGSGRVIQTAFDLQAGPLANWSGNQELWGRILSLQGFDMQYREHNFNNIWNLLNVSQYFPQLQLFSVKTISIAMLFYMVLIGPGLYLFLRRKDKREWGWGALPAISLTLTAVILVYGFASHKSKVYTQAVGVINITDSNYAKVESVQSFVVPNGGVYRVEAVTGSYLQPQVQLNRLADFRVTEDHLHPAVEFQDVEYMTTRSVAVTAPLRDAGSIEGRLALKGDRLVGMISNKSRFNLKDVRLVVGMKTAVLPDLPIGKTQEVNISLQPQSFTEQSFRPEPVNPARAVPAMQGVAISYPDKFGGNPAGIQKLSEGLVPVDAGLNLLKNQRYSQIAQYAAMREPFAPGTLKLAGWTEESANVASVPNQANEPGALFLVLQDLPVDFLPNEKVSIPSELLPSRIVTHTGIRDWGFPYRSPVLGRGDAVSEVVFPAANSFRIDRVQLQYSPFTKETPKSLQYQLRNWQTGRWDDLKTDGTTTFSAAEIAPYLKNGNLLQVRINNQTTTDLPVVEPVITVEGEAKS